jgi:hypothetical protein
MHLIGILYLGVSCILKTCFRFPEMSNVGSITEHLVHIELWHYSYHKGNKLVAVRHNTCMFNHFCRSSELYNYEELIVLNHVSEYIEDINLLGGRT